MIENNPANVSSAFEMLLEEVEAEIDFINGVGSRSFQGRNYERVQEALERSKYSMVNEGLLKNDSPHGVWEISDKGRAMLKDQKTTRGGN